MVPRLNKSPANYIMPTRVCTYVWASSARLSRTTIVRTAKEAMKLEKPGAPLVVYSCRVQFRVRTTDRPGAST